MGKGNVTFNFNQESLRCFYQTTKEQRLTQGAGRQELMERRKKASGKGLRWGQEEEVK